MIFFYFYETCQEFIRGYSNRHLEHFLVRRLYCVNSSSPSTKPCGIPCFNLNLYQSFSLGNRNWNNLIQLINDRCSNDPNKMLKAFGITSSTQKLIDESSFRMCVIERAKWSQFDQRDATSGPTAIPHDFPPQSDGGAGQSDVPVHTTAQAVTKQPLSPAEIVHPGALSRSRWLPSGGWRWP